MGFHTCSGVENEFQGYVALIASFELHCDRGRVFLFASVPVTKRHCEQYRAVGVFKEVLQPKFELRQSYPNRLLLQHRANIPFCPVWIGA